MQIALPFGLPLDKNLLGLGALLLAGVTVMPLKTSDINQTESKKRYEFQDVALRYEEEHDRVRWMQVKSEPEPEREMSQIKEMKDILKAKAEKRFSLGMNQFNNKEMSVNLVNKEWMNEPSVKELAPYRGSNNEGLSEKIVKTAQSWLGVPYYYGGTTPKGVDCSGLVQNVFKQNGVELPRTSQEQFRSGVGVPSSQLKMGDLVFFSTTGSGASHVGIYIGNQEFVSATREKVEIQSLDQTYWNQTYRGSRRVVP